jgi:hypothetical protein
MVCTNFGIDDTDGAVFAITGFAAVALLVMTKFQDRAAAKKKTAAATTTVTGVQAGAGTGAGTETTKGSATRRVRHTAAASAGMSLLFMFTLVDCTSGAADSALANVMKHAEFKYGVPPCAAKASGGHCGDVPVSCDDIGWFSSDR